MERELKIVMKYQEEDLDHDGDENPNVSVYVDGDAVGFIQHFSMSVNAITNKAEIKISFPDIDFNQIEDRYFVKRQHHTPLSHPEIEHNVKKVSVFPNVQVEKVNFLKDKKDMAFLQEVGTNGFIDSFPIKKG